MALLLRDVLVKEGFETVAEMSGRAALAEAERRHFDLAIVDKAMPDVDGLKLLEQLRARLPEVRLIFLTAFGGSLLSRAARKRGADRYFDKPVRLDDLIAAVKTVLAMSRRAT